MAEKFKLKLYNYALNQIIDKCSICYTAIESFDWFTLEQFHKLKENPGAYFLGCTKCNNGKYTYVSTINEIKQKIKVYTFNYDDYLFAIPVLTLKI